MSDNLLLTLLGAVGIGALVMGMNTENVKENWVGMEHIKVDRVKMYIDPKTGEERAVEANDEDVERAVLNIGKAVRKDEMQKRNLELARKQKQVKENYEDDMYSPLATLPPQTENYEDDLRKFNLEPYSDDEPLQTRPPGGPEYWPEHEPQLGSGMVANDFFHRVPQFNQSIPQPSPDMQNLGMPARMHQPGVQGYTDAFNQPMQYASLIGTRENFEDPKPSVRPQQIMGSANLPPTDMNNPSQAPENVVVFERLMASTKGGGRFRQKGSVDYIRGDIPVCPDPCQNGWFKSSAKPQDVLQVGAVAQMIAGDDTARNLELLLKNNGSIVTQFNQFSPSSMATQVSQTGATLGTRQQLP